MVETPASVTVEGISKRFAPAGGVTRLLVRSPRRRAIVALDGVSFSLARGEIAALVGPNGAGKSTLLRVLATLLMPDGGTVRVGGHDVVGDPVARCARRRPWSPPTTSRSRCG